VRITSDDDIVVVDVTAAQGPPGPAGPPGPPGEGAATIITPDDPSDDGLAADLGALALYTDQSPPVLFLKHDAADTDWTQVITANAKEITIENKATSIVSEDVNLSSTRGTGISLGFDLVFTGPVLQYNPVADMYVNRLSGTADPSAGAGVPANPGSTYQRDNAGTGELWLKTGAADTAWQKVALVP
jgi:hypothetical protein